MFRQKDKKFTRSGVAALPVILLTSLIVTELVIAGVLVAYLLTSTTSGARQANRALAAAQAGVSDAAMKITRNKDFTSSSSTLSFGDNLYAEVVVRKDYPIAGKHEIKSTGYISTAGIRRFSRQLQVILNVNSATGKVELESFNEI